MNDDDVVIFDETRTALLIAELLRQEFTVSIAPTDDELYTDADGFMGLVVNVSAQFPSDNLYDAMIDMIEAMRDVVNAYDESAY